MAVEFKGRIIEAMPNVILAFTDCETMQECLDLVNLCIEYGEELKLTAADYLQIGYCTHDRFKELGIYNVGVNFGRARIDKWEDHLP